MSRVWFLLVSLISVSLFVAADTPAKKAPAKKQPNPAMAAITDEPGLPRVLLIGDSISIGYTLPTRELLKGKANVHRIPTNGGPTTNGLTNIDKWLGSSKWDVIHFNWGLHDLKYINEKGDRVEPGKGKVQVPLDQYEANLRKLVQRMKQTGAKLVWCTTTPVPKGSDGRLEGDEEKYNAVAAKIMQAEQVATNDLCAFAKPQMDKIGLPANVHFSPEGSKVLATKVAEAIMQQLAK
jgi:hypothetical protein